MVRVIVEDFTEADTLVVNDEVLSGSGDAPPSSPPSQPDPVDYNHFGDWPDTQWGLSFTEGRNNYANQNVSSAPGQEYNVTIPTYLVGQQVRLVCGGPNAAGNVRIKNADGSTITKEYLTSSGHILFSSSKQQTVRVKMIDGHPDTLLAWDLYQR